MIPIRFAEASEGVAYEERMLAADRPRLAVWQADQTSMVVPGSWTRREGFDAAKAICAEAGWPLVIRSSGGGAVPQGLGTVNLAFVVPRDQGFVLEDGYRLICGAIADALGRFNIATDVGAVDGSFCDGAWNVTVGGKKLAGTAQRWCVRARGHIALVHAAILLDLPPASFWRALDAVHRAAGVPGQVRADAHVTLQVVAPAAVRTGSIFDALILAVEDRLAALEQKRGQLDRAA